MSKIVEHSIISKKYQLFFGLAIAVVGLFIVAYIYYWVVRGIALPNQMVMFLMLFAGLIERTQPKYTFELDKRQLRVVKRGIIGEQVYEVPLKAIFGVYRYRAKLIGVIRFRRTYRMNSALDPRDVWSVAYTAEGKKGKEEHRRIYFKPSEEMLNALREVLPNRVMSTEEKVIIEAVNREAQAEITNENKE